MTTPTDRAARLADEKAARLAKLRREYTTSGSSADVPFLLNLIDEMARENAATAELLDIDPLGLCDILDNARLGAALRPLCPEIRQRLVSFFDANGSNNEGRTAEIIRAFDAALAPLIEQAQNDAAIDAEQYNRPIREVRRANEQAQEGK